MRIGLIADTHIPRDAKMLPPHVKDAFEDVDLILHAGDIYAQKVLDELEAIAPVLAARGNGDGHFPEDHRLKDNHIINISLFKLGLTHAMVYPELAHFPLDKEMERKFGGHMDIVVFGDTHVALVEKFKGVLLINPGSPTLPNSLFELGTVGLLQINEGSVEANIIQLSQFQLNFSMESIYH
ncbi:metallophosphoesterase family protein [Chloroflexota bacterium]